jgi:glucose dehydrogenase
MAVPSKDGWLYLYDRDTRALLARKETTTHLNSEIEPSSKPTRICPGTLGGTEWNGAGYDPMRGRLFVGSVDWCGTYIRQSGKDRNAFGGRVIFDQPEKARGWLRAFDAATGRPLWTYHADAPMIAGITPTAGGVVFTGSGNGDFLAFDSMTGKILYKFKTGGAIGGGVSSYAVGGRQYVVVASGNASRTIWRTQGRATLVVFALPN